MKRKWILVALAVLLLTAVSFLMFHLYSEGTEEVLSQFQGHQLSYARQLSNHIQSFIQARSRGLKALSTLASFQHGDLWQQRRDIEAYSKQIEQVSVKKISFINERGRIVYSTDPAAIGLNQQGSQLFAWARKGEYRGKIILTPVFPESQTLTFDLAIPLYQEVSEPKDSKSREKFAGVLACTLDMKEFLANELATADPKMNLDQVWIMDKNGTLLFQPDHPKMVFRNIYQKEGSCRLCHPSFDYIEKILIKREGTMDYKIENHPKKIAAFASMEFENISWMVVVNAPYDRVTGFIKKSLREHLFLIGIVVLGLAVSSAFVIRKERMKIQAEEEVIRWQEKMAERKKAEEALEGERNKLKAILDSMADGVYIVNQQHEVLYVNPVIQRDRGAVKGRKCYEYLHDLPEVCSWCKNHEVLAGETIRWERYSTKTGKTYDLLDTPILYPDGTPCKLQFMRDVSDRKKIEKALRQSEKRYRMLVDTMSEGLGVQDENGVWIYVNDRFCEMLGYPRDEMIGRRLTDFLGETDWSIYQEQVAKRRKGEVGSYRISWLNRDGLRISTRVSPKAIFDEQGQFKGSFAVITDMTEHNRAAEALRESEKQLRYLSSQLLTAQETERKRVSRELHDELGQSLTVMKLRLSFIEKNLSEYQAELKQECEYGVEYIDQVIENVRRLSRDLSPTILEDFGLSAALRWLINNFVKNYNIKVVLEMVDVDSLLSQDSHVVVYRTVQEVLTNIGKHSQAKNVSVAINVAESSVNFSIEDDGIGFDEKAVAARNPREKGLGLATMKGRAQMVGGALNIRTSEGKGTLITLSIPIKGTVQA